MAALPVDSEHAKPANRAEQAQLSVKETSLEPLVLTAASNVSWHRRCEWSVEVCKCLFESQSPIAGSPQ